MSVGYRTTDWYMEIAGERNSNFSFVHKFGRNPAASTAWEDVWVNGAIYDWPTAAFTIEAISSAAADTAGSTGAQTIIVQGLDANWAVAQATITMNGLTVTSSTTQQFIRINRAFVDTAGIYSQTTSGSNVGVITIRKSGTGATQCLLGIDTTIGMGQTGIARYSVPKNYTAFLLGANIQVDSGKTAQVVLWQRPNANDVITPYSGSKRMVAHFDGVAGNINWQLHGAPIAFPAYTDIWWSIKASAAAGVSVDFPLVLKNNGAV